MTLLRARSTLVILAPWVAVGLLLWRQRGLEARMEDWVRAVNKTMSAMAVVDELVAAERGPA